MPPVTVVEATPASELERRNSAPDIQPESWSFVSSCFYSDPTNERGPFADGDESDLDPGEVDAARWASARTLAT